MSLIIRQKKGALQLSINAIVVLILAITMLGLGLGFMRNMFGQTTGQFDEIASDMKNQIIEEIQASSDKIILNKYDIDLKKAETKEIYYGIKNVEQEEKTFTIETDCTEAMGTGNADDIEINTFGSKAIPAGDVSVLKMNVKAASAATMDTYSCYIRTSIGADVIAKKEFYVTVN